MDNTVPVRRERAEGAESETEGEQGGLQKEVGRKQNNAKEVWAGSAQHQSLSLSSGIPQEPSAEDPYVTLEVTFSQINRQLEKLNLGKAAGLDGISPRVLKTSGPHIPHHEGPGKSVVTSQTSGQPSPGCPEICLSTAG
ncbi:hypothetical protein AOLI_G00105810 [Acnodon oligacanthus]